MKIQHGVLVFLLVSFAAVPAFAQTTTGSNTSITLPTPPRPMASMPVTSTPGVDSTYQGNVQPNLQGTYTLTVPWTYSGSGSGSAAAVPAATVQSHALPKPSRTDASTQQMY